MKLLVVGRHSPDVGSENEVVLVENINFGGDMNTVCKQIDDLDAKAREAGAHIALQAVPAIVAATIIREVVWGMRWKAIFAIVSKPGPRPAGVIRVVSPSEVDVIKFVNPNAKFHIGEHGDTILTVDPPMKFEFAELVQLC